MAKTSINVRACNIGSAERHNLRSKELDYIRPELTHRNEQWVEHSIPEVHQDIAEKYKATTGQGLQKKATPIREGVVVIQEDTTIGQLRELADRLEQRFGVHTFQIYTHKDEGAAVWNGLENEWKPNYHAHMIFDWTDGHTGKTIKLNQHDMAEMQTITAECLGMERGIMTGITRASKESIFSDLNNLEVVTTTSDKYATTFGFTESEVFHALEECGLESEKNEVKRWYDGFIFGTHKDIYNPWSILNYLDSQQYTTYWANTSANSLVGKLVREGNRNIKEKFEKLLCGECIWSEIDEQIVYNQLNGNEQAVWSLLLASGYLKVLSYEKYKDIPEGTEPKYQLALTNLEVKLMFQRMIRDWFATVQPDYNDFVKAMFIGDVDAMNEYMNRVALQTFSYFDTGDRASGAEPERFYHGFVLGLLVDLQDRYYVKSNRESGFGRYDVMLEPKHPGQENAVILEFKARSTRKEKSLEETAQSALEQIRQRKYREELKTKGIKEEQIKEYGFAFEGKTVLIVD